MGIHSWDPATHSIIEIFVCSFGHHWAYSTDYSNKDRLSEIICGLPRTRNELLIQFKVDGRTSRFPCCRICFQAQHDFMHRGTYRDVIDGELRQRFLATLLAQYKTVFRWEGNKISPTAVEDIEVAFQAWKAGRIKR